MFSRIVNSGAAVMSAKNGATWCDEFLLVAEYFARTPQALKNQGVI